MSGATTTRDLTSAVQPNRASARSRMCRSRRDASGQVRPIDDDARTRRSRFLQVDPVEGGSANDYDYCNGDPINCMDLDGMAPSTRQKILQALWVATIRFNDSQKAISRSPLSPEAHWRHAVARNALAATRAYLNAYDYPVKAMQPPRVLGAPSPLRGPNNGTNLDQPHIGRPGQAPMVPYYPSDFPMRPEPMWISNGGGGSAIPLAFGCGSRKCM